MDTSRVSPIITARPTGRGGTEDARHRWVRFHTSCATRRTDVLAAEDAGGYRTGTSRPADQHQARASATVAAHAQLMQGLSQAVDALIARSIDELQEPDLKAELQAVEAERRRLEARQSRLAAALSARAAARARTAARTARRGEDVADRNARRELQRELTADLGWSPTDAKQAVELGRRLEPSQDAGRAFDRGSLTRRHAATLSDTLRWIDDLERQREAEATLLPLAAEQDPVTFGRTCRRLLAELDPNGSERAAERRRRRRKATTWQDEDGMLGVSARLTGVGAELFATAFHAFRRPDAPEERRTSEQAGADALVAMAKAALDAGTASADRTVRPHAVITLDWQAIARDAGLADGTWMGPLPLSEVRQLLTDSGVSRLIMGSKSAVIEAGEESRAVPAAVYRAIAIRDGSCIGAGCDVPPIYCQVMHLETPYRFGGRLTIGTSGLGCGFHHDALDRRGWKITWIGDRPVLHHPDRPPTTSSDPPDPSDATARQPADRAPPDP